jgi:hypothetical protein
LEKKILRRIFRPKIREATKEWRNLHNEVYKLFSSHNIIILINSWMLRWEENVTWKRM